MDKNLAHKIASALHEDWRKTRLNADGTYEPRWKKVKDIEFVKNLDLENMPSNVRITNDVVEIDIANSTYDMLSEDWKAENKAAAEVVATIFEKEETIGRKMTRDEVGTIIHNEWLKRNDWVYNPEYGNPALTVPFAELPADEQAKDIDQYKIGQKVAEKTLGGK